jgi:hypothetical protein
MVDLLAASVPDGYFVNAMAGSWHWTFQPPVVIDGEIHIFSPHPRHCRASTFWSLGKVLRMDMVSEYEDILAGLRG